MSALTRRAALAGGAALALGLGVDAVADRREAAGLAAFPPEGRVVEVGGRRVHGVTRGEGRDVVLLHGALGSSRDLLFGLVDRLAQRFRVTAFDRPGAGHTDRASAAHEGPFTRRGETPAEQASLLLAAAPAFGIERPVVLGHSFGASVAMAWALADPAGTAALVIVAGIVVPGEGPDNLLFRVNGSRLGGALIVPIETALAPQAAVDRSLRTVFAPNPIPEGYAAWSDTPLSLRREALRAGARQVLALRPALRGMEGRYASLPMPVEVVQGDADAITDGLAQSDRLLALVPQARRTVLAGVGHMPHHADPEAVVAAVERASTRAGLP